jgi:hypothetical protein
MLSSALMCAALFNVARGRMYQNSAEAMRAWLRWYRRNPRVHWLRSENEKNSRGGVSRLPQRALADRGASRSRWRPTRARLRRTNSGDIDAGGDDDDDDAVAQAATGGRRPGPARYRLAARIHHHLEIGSVSQAARVFGLRAATLPTPRRSRRSAPHNPLPRRPRPWLRTYPRCW